MTQEIKPEEIKPQSKNTTVIIGELFQTYAEEMSTQDDRHISKVATSSPIFAIQPRIDTEILNLRGVFTPPKNLFWYLFTDIGEGYNFDNPYILFLANSEEGKQHQKTNQTQNTSQNSKINPKQEINQTNQSKPTQNTSQNQKTDQNQGINQNSERVQTNETNKGQKKDQNQEIIQIQKTSQEPERDQLLPSTFYKFMFFIDVPTRILLQLRAYEKEFKNGTPKFWILGYVEFDFHQILTEYLKVKPGKGFPPNGAFINFLLKRHTIFFSKEILVTINVSENIENRRFLHLTLNDSNCITIPSSIFKKPKPYFSFSVNGRKIFRSQIIFKNKSSNHYDYRIHSHLFGWDKYIIQDDSNKSLNENDFYNVQVRFDNCRSNMETKKIGDGIINQTKSEMLAIEVNPNIEKKHIKLEFQSEIQEQWSIIDFLQDALFNVYIAIDFNKENGDIRSPKSLHTLIDSGYNIYQQIIKALGSSLLPYSAEFHFEPINCKTPNCEKEKSKSNEQDQNVSQPNDNEKSTNVNEQSKPTKQEENISKSTNENEQSKSTKQEEKSTSSNNEATDLVHFSRNIRDLVDSYRRTALNVSMEEFNYDISSWVAEKINLAKQSVKTDSVGFSYSNPNSSKNDKSFTFIFVVCQNNSNYDIKEVLSKTDENITKRENRNDETVPRLLVVFIIINKERNKRELLNQKEKADKKQEVTLNNHYNLDVVKLENVRYSLTQLSTAILRKLPKLFDYYGRNLEVKSSIDANQNISVSSNIEPHLDDFEVVM